MSQYEYTVVIGTTITIEAGSPEEAKRLAQDYYEENFPEVDTAVIIQNEANVWPDPETAIVLNTEGNN